MSTLFSGINPISGSSLSSQDQEKLNKLKIDGDGTKVLSDNGEYILNIDKASITTTIDSTSTDSEAPSALAIFNLLKTVYPVGSIYINTTDVNPSTIFGFGTWERVAQNMTLWGSSADGQVGTTKSAGLPNITGRLNGIATFSSSYVNDTLKATKEADSNLSPGTGVNHFSTITLNASKSSSIYGNSTTVQPPALVVNIWKRNA